MHFSMKNTLKNNHNHTHKQLINDVRIILYVLICETLFN